MITTHRVAPCLCSWLLTHGLTTVVLGQGSCDRRPEALIHGQERRESPRDRRRGFPPSSARFLSVRISSVDLHHLFVCVLDGLLGLPVFHFQESSSRCSKTYVDPLVDARQEASCPRNNLKRSRPIDIGTSSTDLPAYRAPTDGRSGFGAGATWKRPSAMPCPSAAHVTR
jgi:hypothetical protein